MYKVSHKQYFQEYGKQYTQLIKRRAMQMVGNDRIECVRCGCNDIRLLEINHVNGGGAKDHKNTGLGGFNFYRAIVKGLRKTDDLDIHCRVCNALHYLELKYGRLDYDIHFKT